jgi:Rap1a immunity proteins
MKVVSVVGVLAASIIAMAEPRRTVADEYWMHDFVVLTMAFDGAWGVGVDPSINRAIATAIANCKAMSGANLGCGAQMTTVRAGWSVGFRCGRHNILVADRDFAEVQRIAFNREQELRDRYDPAMPPCVRVVMVSPGGMIAPSPTLSVRSKRAVSALQIASAAGTDDLATGDEVLNECRAAISPTPASLGDNPVQSSLRLGLCIGVVSAVFTIARDERLICMPRVAMPTLHVVRVVVAFVEARPQRSHEPFVLLAYDAVADAWPCRP